MVVALKPYELPAISKQSVNEAGKAAVEGKPLKNNSTRVVPPAFQKISNTKIDTKTSNRRSVLNEAAEMALIKKPSIYKKTTIEESLIEEEKEILKKAEDEAAARTLLSSIPALGSLINQREVVPIVSPKETKSIIINAPDIKSLPVENKKTSTKVYTVERNDTLSGIFKKMGYDAALTNQIATALIRNANFSVTNLKLGQKLIFTEQIENGKKKLIKFQVPNNLRMITLNTDQLGSYQVTEKKAEVNTKFVYKTGMIRSNINNLAIVVGIPSKVISSAVRAISNKLDLNRDVKVGDKFEILYEQVYNTKGILIDPGRVYYIALQRGMYKVEAFRFTTDGTDRTLDFYDISATAFKQSITNKPLLVPHRVTSGFGYRRHPVLGRSMMHTGVDYAARVGTVVTAAGDGTIAKIGRFGGYGNYVRIKHDEVWSTAYGHLSRFASGLRVGSRVKKGQVVAYSGNTGRSTGPHLHFEVLRYGRAINPLTAQLPSSKRLWGKDYSNYQMELKKIRDILFDKKGAYLSATAPIPQEKPDN